MKAGVDCSGSVEVAYHSGTASVLGAGSWELLGSPASPCSSQLANSRVPGLLEGSGNLANRHVIQQAEQVHHLGIYKSASAPLFRSCVV